MIALALALSLGAAPAVAKIGRPGEPPPPAASARVLGHDGLGGEAARIDPDVMGFLSLSRAAARLKGTAGRDGSAKLQWEGAGADELKLSWEPLDRRNDALARGDLMAGVLVEAVWSFYEGTGGRDPDATRARLRGIVDGPMEEARAAYLGAVSWEERRLFFVQRALAQARAAGVVPPGIDRELVEKRMHAIQTGAVNRILAAQLDGYRDLALGIVAYLDGDSFGALQKMRSAAQALPELSVAHAFLGSMYFLFSQREAAVASWRRAYELDPSNTAVAEALEQHGHAPRHAKK